jgi:glycosyltransferase involved in cell wall biosynthesis
MTAGPLRPLLLGMGWAPDQPGGLNRHFRALYEQLEELGHAPEAVVVGPAADAPPGVRVPTAATDPLPLRLWRYAQAVEPRGEVVHAHFALYALLPLLLGRLRGRPLVIQFQGPWADESEAGGERSAWRLAAKRSVERAVYRRGREFLVLSSAFRRILVERYRVVPWHVHVVPPGVDASRFAPGDRAAARAELGVPEDARVAVCVRRLVPRMGIDVLLDAWALLPAGWLLLVAGEGPARQALERRAAGLGLRDRVRFLGWQVGDDLVRCYRAADVSVVPTVALEGFGMIVLESLACGTPVVVTDVGGLPEAVGPFDPSLVVPAADPEALARRLRAPLPDAGRCRAFAEENSWRRTAERTLETYERARRPRPPERIRVVYLDHTAALSGGELALLRLLPALADRIEPHVILAQNGPLAERMSQAGISVEVLPLRERARALSRAEAGLASLGAAAAAAYAARLAARLRRYRPALVHTNSLKAALYGGLAGRLAGVPVVWHVRDRIAPDYLPESTVRLVHAAARVLPRAVVANSAATAATLPHAVVVPSPVRVEPAERSEEGALRVGIVGRIAPWKGQHVFLEAFARAFPAGAERGVVVGAPMFGADEERYLARLHEQAAELGLDGRVRFLGFREDVAAELAGLDVLVHASTTPEPFGQVVAEGMAAGLAVVAAGAGGPAEMIEDGVSGVLYPPGDVEALAAALRRLTDPELRRRLGDRARAAVGDFLPERVADRIVDVYRDVLR